MNISDPFNRLSSKREAEYQALKQHMQDMGIDSKEKAEAMQKQSQRNTLAIMLVVVIACLLVVLIWPTLLGMTSVIGGLIILVLFTTMLRANRSINRYKRDCV